MKMYILRIAFIAVSVSGTSAHASSQDDWSTLSDIGAYGLTAIAIGTPLVKGDENGALQAGGSFVGAKLTAQALKYIFPETRPDGSDRKSFPSGHTAAAFAAAASIYERQGAEMGIPAFAIAGFVGVARVKADKHHWYDVAAGAGIGLASGLLITRKPENRQMAIVPWGDSHGGGVSVAMRF